MPFDPFAGDNVTVAPKAVFDPFAAPTAPVSAIPAPIASMPSMGQRIFDLLNKTYTASPSRAAYDYGSSIADQATIGGADKLQSMITGEPVEAIRARTQQAQSEIPPVMNAITGAAAYGLGPGKILGPLAKGVAGGGIIGAGAEGAAAGGAGALGHGGSLADAMYGAVTGGGLGVGLGSLATGAGYLGNKIAGALGWKPGASTTASTRAAKENAYDQLKNTPLDIGDTRSAVQNTRNSVNTMDPTGGFQKNAPRTMAVFDNLQDYLANTNSVTAHDLIALGLDKLNKIPNTGGEAELKPAITASLNNYLENSPAAGILPQAKALNSQYENAKMLEEMRGRVADFGDTTGPASQARTALQDNPQFYQLPGQEAAMKNIGRSGGGPSVGAPLETGAGLMTGAVAGQYLGHTPLAAGLGAMTGLMRPLAAQSASRRAILDAYPALTGQAPPNYEQQVGDLLRTLIGSYMSGKARTPYEVPGAGFVLPFIQ